MANSIPINAYVGMPKNRLLSMLSKTLDKLDSDDLGDIVTSTSNRDLSVTIEPSGASHEKLQAIQYALWKLDPNLYQQPDSTKVKRYYTL